MKRARHLSESNNVSHTIQDTAPVKAVDAFPKFDSGMLRADVTADTVKEVAISANSAAVATPFAAVSSKHSIQCR